MKLAELDELVDRALAAYEGGARWGDAVLDQIGGACPRGDLFRRLCVDGCEGDECDTRRMFKAVCNRMKWRANNGRDSEPVRNALD